MISLDELTSYRDNLVTLLRDRGKYVVIKGNEIIGVYRTQNFCHEGGTAFRAGCRRQTDRRGGAGSRDRPLCALMTSHTITFGSGKDGPQTDVVKINMAWDGPLRGCGTVFVTSGNGEGRTGRRTRKEGQASQTGKEGQAPQTQSVTILTAVQGRSADTFAWSQSSASYDHRPAKGISILIS